MKLSYTNQTRNSKGIAIDWRLVVTGHNPETFSYHPSLDEALNIAMLVDSTCPGCKRPASDCPEYCSEYEEWFIIFMEKNQKDV